MKIDTACKIITENSAGNIEVVDFSDLLSGLVIEGVKGSVVSDIANIYPLTGGNSGYVFGAYKDEDTLKIKKRFLNSTDHIIITDMTKETVDDINKMFGENASEIIISLIKRDLILDQDKEVFNYIRTIMQLKPDIEVSKSDMYNSSLVLKHFVDDNFINMMSDLKFSSETAIITTPAIAAMMLRSDNTKPRKENSILSYIGQIGDREIYVDFNSTYDYIAVGYCGDETLRGITFAPYNMMLSYHERYEDGAIVMRINNRYAFSRNVLDNEGDNDSRFCIGAKVIIKENDDEDNTISFIEAFNQQIQP